MEVVCHEGDASDDVATVRADSDSIHPQLRRFDILSDSRLSQLFELSANLEAVATAAANGSGHGHERKLHSSWSKVDSIFGGGEGEGEGGNAGEQDFKTASKFNRYETPNANHRIATSPSSNANLEIKVSSQDPSSALLCQIHTYSKVSLAFLFCSLIRSAMHSSPRVSTSYCRPPLAGTLSDRTCQIRRRRNRSRRRSPTRGRRRRLMMRGRAALSTHWLRWRLRPRMPPPVSRGRGGPGTLPPAPEPRRPCGKGAASSWRSLCRSSEIKHRTSANC